MSWVMMSATALITLTFTQEIIRDRKPTSERTVLIFQRLGRTFTRVDQLVRVQGYTKDQTQFWKPIRCVLEARRRWKARRLVPGATLRLRRTLGEQRILIHEQRPCDVLSRREIILRVFVSR